MIEAELGMIAAAILRETSLAQMTAWARCSNSCEAGRVQR